MGVERGPRVRRANVAGGRLGRHVVRTSAEEEGVLALKAARARVSVPRLLVEAALADGGETVSDRRALVVELFAVRRELAACALRADRADPGWVAEAWGLATRLDAAIDGLAADGVG